MTKRRKNTKNVNSTKLDQQFRHKNKLSSPFSAFIQKHPVQMNSWTDSRLPNILWACLLVSKMKRDDYLPLFKLTFDVAHKRGTDAFQFITHKRLSEADYPTFEQIMGPLLSSSEARHALRPLRLLTTLPDIAHWNLALDDPKPESDWREIAATIAKCFDHQSPTSTDVRWLKVMYLVASGKLKMPPARIQKLLDYPKNQDHLVAGGICRATEITFSMSFDGKEPSLDGNFDAESFWRECYESSKCYPATMESGSAIDLTEASKELIALYEAVATHFWMTSTSTSIDARHDSSFVLVLYALYLLAGLTEGKLDQRAEGRLILRCISEAFINLHWLTQKDDLEIWKQYRNYGVGQSKLSLLKNVDSDQAPDFIDLADLERYANEDYWQEIADINLGHWANRNLRTLAEECGVKNVYDRHYDWSSAYVHANWGALRDTVMVTCLNPLHRFHRIPAAPRVEMPSVLVDGARLVNRMMDDLNTLYPPFKPRITWHNKKMNEQQRSDHKK